jgi:hypothetical protein
MIFHVFCLDISFLLYRTLLLSAGHAWILYIYDDRGWDYCFAARDTVWRQCNGNEAELEYVCSLSENFVKQFRTPCSYSIVHYPFF